MSSNDNFKFYVIGAGIPRTGTLSTKTALEILLPGKCMHMRDVVKDVDTNLRNALEGDVTDETFKQHFINNNIVAGVDMPFILKYEQAMRVFPDALVLLTVREPETWVKSMKNTICKAHSQLFKSFPTSLLLWIYPPMRRLSKFLEASTFDSIIQKINNGDGVESFNNYVEEVKVNVPAERLLVFNVKEGWKPLCEALHLPIPDVEFPRVYDTATMQRRFVIIKVVAWGIFISGLTLTSLTLGYGLKLYVQADSSNSLLDQMSNISTLIYQHLFNY